MSSHRKFVAILVAVAGTSALAGYAVSTHNLIPGHSGGISSARAAAARASGSPTLADVDDASHAASTAAAFKPLIDAGVLKGARELVNPAKIPTGPYAGSLVRRAEGDGNVTCVAVLDASGCGTLSADNPVVSGVAAHPDSALPPLAYGAVRSDVSAVAVACGATTVEANVMAGGVFAAVLPMNTNTDACTAQPR